MAYSQDTGLFYLGANHWKEDYWTEEVHYTKGAAYLGQGFRIRKMYDDHVGVLRAVDPKTGEIAWSHKEKLPLWSGVLATKGNLIFTGTGEGYFKAFDAKLVKNFGSSRQAQASYHPQLLGLKMVSNISASLVDMAALYHYGVEIWQI